MPNRIRYCPVAVAGRKLIEIPFIYDLGVTQLSMWTTMDQDKYIVHTLWLADEETSDRIAAYDEYLTSEPYL